MRFWRLSCSAVLREIRVQLLHAETQALDAIPRTQWGASPRYKLIALQLQRAAETQARMERILYYAEMYFLENFRSGETLDTIMRKEQELRDPYSCLNRAEPYELIFTLLARDAAAPVAIRAWIAERLRLGKNTPDDAQIQNAERCAKLMELERVNRK